MDYSLHNNKFEELGLHFEPDNSISPQIFTPIIPYSQNVYYPPEVSVYLKPEQTEVTQLLVNGEHLNSNNVISENYYNLAHHLESTRLKNDNQGTETHFNYQTAEPMCNIEKLHSNIQFQLNENNLNDQGILQRTYLKNECPAFGENDFNPDTLNASQENQGFVESREDTAELLDFDLNIFIDNDGNFVSQTSETVVPVALSKASQEDHEKALKKKKIKPKNKEPKPLPKKKGPKPPKNKDSTEIKVKRRKLSKNQNVVPIALISGPMILDNFVLNAEPKKRGRPKNNSILPDLPNCKLTKTTTNMPKRKYVKKNVIKHIEDDHTQLATQNLKIPVQTYTTNVITKPTSPMILDNFVVNAEPKKRGRPRNNSILPDLPNHKLTKTTTNLPKCSYVKKNVLKHIEDDQTQLATPNLKIPVQTYTRNVVTKPTSLAACPQDIIKSPPVLNSINLCSSLNNISLPELTPEDVEKTKLSEEFIMMPHNSSTPVRTCKRNNGTCKPVSLDLLAKPLATNINQEGQIDGYLLVIPEGFELQNPTEDKSKDFVIRIANGTSQDPEVNGLPTVTEELNSEETEVKGLQIATEESNFENPEVNVLQISTEMLNMEDPEVNVLQTSTKESNLEDPVKTIFFNSVINPNSVTPAAKNSNLVQKQNKNYCRNEEVSDLVISVTENLNLVRKQIKTFSTNKKVAEPMVDSKISLALLENKPITYGRIKNTSDLVTPVAENLNLVLKTRKTNCRSKKVTNSVTSETENLNLVRIPTKTYSRNKKVSESMIDGTMDNPITIDEEEPISTVKPAIAPIGISRPTVIKYLNNLHYEASFTESTLAACTKDIIITPTVSGSINAPSSLKDINLTQLTPKDIDKTKLSQNLLIGSRVSNTFTHNLSTPVRRYKRNDIHKPLPLNLLAKSIDQKTMNNDSILPQIDLNYQEQNQKQPPSLIAEPIVWSLNTCNLSIPVQQKFALQNPTKDIFKDFAIQIESEEIKFEDLEVNRHNTVIDESNLDDLEVKGVEIGSEGSNFDNPEVNTLQIMTGESNLEDPEINILETQTKDSNSPETKSLRCQKAYQSYEEVEIPCNTEKWNKAMDSLHSELVLMPEWVPLNVVEPEKEDEVTSCIVKVEPEFKFPLSNLTKLSIASTSEFRLNKTTLKMPVVVLERLKFPINTKTSSRKTNLSLIERNSQLSTFKLGSKLLSSSKRTIGPLSKQKSSMTVPDKNLSSLLGTDKVLRVRLHRYIPPKSSKYSLGNAITVSSEQEIKLLEASITVDSSCKKLNYNLQEGVSTSCPTLVPDSQKYSSSKINFKKNIATKLVKKPKIMLKKPLKKLPKKTNIQSQAGISVDQIIPKIDDQISSNSLGDQHTLSTSFKPSVSFSHSSFDNQTRSVYVVNDQSEFISSVNYTSSVSLDQVNPSNSDPHSFICEALVRELISKVLLEETISEVILGTSFSDDQEDDSICVALMKDLISEVLMEETISKVVDDKSVFEVPIDESDSEALVRFPISEIINDPNLIKDVSTFSESVELTYKTVDPVFEPEVFHHILETFKKAKATGKRKNKYICEICRQKCKSTYELKYHKKSVHNVGRLILDRYKCPNCDLSFSRKYDYEKHRYSTHNIKKFTCKLCANQFPSLRLLRDHERRHEDNHLYKFKCLFCGREFKDLTSRNRHMYCHTTSRPFKCNLCRKTFLTNAILVRHKMVHEDKKKGIRCARCKIVLENWQQYMEHMNVDHREQEQYNCEICTQNFTTKATLTRHKTLNHFDKCKLFTCEVCATPFSSLNSLNRHRKSHMMKDNQQKHDCVTCGKSYSFPSSLRNHIAQWHSNLRPFKCDLCDKDFAYRAIFIRHKLYHKKLKRSCPICKREVVNLRSHTRLCHPNKNEIARELEKIDLSRLAFKFPCFLCKAVYETELELTEHICFDTLKQKRKSMVSQFLCLICKRTYRTERLREEHCLKCHLPLTTSNSTEAIKFRCKTCNRPFDTEDAKNEHWKTHFNVDGTIIEPYSCKLCDKKFASKRRLTKHKSVHDASKRFPCPICFKLFRFPSYVKSHMKIHSGEKNYECKYCGRKFTDRNAKSKHEMIHTGERPYSCNICGKAFNRKATVRLHMLSHTKETPHECVFCGAKYRYYSKFRTHLKKHIKPVDEEEIILGN